MENQSFSMIEAMAHALPIVAVDMRGAPELVDKQNGILVDADSPSALAAAVIRLFSDRLCTKKLAQGSLDKSKKYDLDYSVTRLEKLYRDLVDKKQK
ncbi:glycosyltransferase family 4 protein [Candidatus Gottesmanbacteria bacterium]|nr:glycosyltransferase family 4 protein [Candidatus Gottesmanbacteria bacterium]